MISRQASRLQVHTTQVWMLSKVNRRPGDRTRYERWHRKNSTTILRSVKNLSSEGIMWSGQVNECDFRS